MTARLLFVALTNDVGSDRIVIEAGQHGASCGLLAPRGAYASLPRCVSMRFLIAQRFGSVGRHVFFAGTLKRAVAEWDPDVLVPLDDLSATLLRLLGRDKRVPLRLRTLIERSLGAPAGYDAACGRVPLMQAAARAGVRTPLFAAADDLSRPLAASRVRFPLMVKRDQSSGSGGVTRVETDRALAKALRAARIKTAAKTALARLGGFRRNPSPALLQSVVDGRLAMFTAACRDGRMLDGIGLEAVEVHPTKGASTVLRRIGNPEMEQAARRLVATLGCSGFVSFDFIVDATDRAFLIEMNPRPIGSTHLGRRFGHDLVGAFLTGQPVRLRPTLGSDALVALFPKELERDPNSPYLRCDGVLSDVPDGEPAVVAAYLAHLATQHPAQAERMSGLVWAHAGCTRPAGSPPHWSEGLSIAS